MSARALSGAFSISAFAWAKALADLLKAEAAGQSVLKC
jgi:hypothetical protein